MSARLLGSVTLVAVVGEHVPEAAALKQMAGLLGRHAMECELVLVAGGADGALALTLQQLAAAVPDVMVVFLAGTVHDDVARLVGIEHAVGDYVLFADVLQDGPEALAAVLEPLREGYDLVVARRGAVAVPGPVERVLMAGYRLLYGRVTGAALELGPTGLRAYSRAAALHLAGRPDAELRLRARTVGPGFSATAVEVAGVQVAGRVRHPWSKALGMLLSASTLPLRGALYAALVGGALSALYSLYVFGVFLLKPDVAAGWTTLSLQLSGMMFVFSVVLLFLSEYVIQIFDGAPPRSRRHLVVREVRSPLSARSGRLNVVDGEGRFQLGKPAWLEKPG